MSFNKAKILKSAEKYVQQGKIAAAIEEYRKIVEADSNDLTMINTLGDLCVRAGRTEEAITNFSRIAENYRANGFTLKAIAMYKKINKLEPSNYETSLKLADLYSKQGLIVDARQQYLIVADSYKRSGKTKDALETLKKIADLDPENTSVRLKLAESYQIEGLLEESLEAYLYAGQELMRKGRAAEAIQTYQKSLQINPDSKPALKSVVDALVQQGDLNRALDMLTRSLERKPGDVDLIIILGRTYLSAKMLEEAEATFSQLLELDKSRYDYLIEVGRRFLERGQFENAISIVDRCIDLLIARRQEEKAILLLKGILEYDANYMQALKRLADIYLRVREDYNLIATLNMLVEAALRRGMKNEAIVALQQLADLEPEESSHRQRLIGLGAQRSSATASPAFKNLIPPAFEQAAENYQQQISMSAPAPSFSNIQPSGQEAEKQFREAEMFASRGYADHAADLLEELIAKHPEYIEARLKLKQLYVDGGLEEKAAVQCLDLARLYEEQGDAALANDLISEAFELNPSLNSIPAQTAVPNQEMMLSPNRNSAAAAVAESEGVIEIDLNSSFADISNSSLADVSLEALSYQSDTGQYSNLSNNLFSQQTVPTPPPMPMPAPPESIAPTSFEAFFTGGEQPTSVAPEVISVKGATNSTGQEVGSFEINFTEDFSRSSKIATDKILKDELEGVDFYIAQGYMEIARETLQNLIQQYPNHPAIMQRLANLGDDESQTDLEYKTEARSGADFYADQFDQMEEMPSSAIMDASTLTEEPAPTGNMPNLFDASGELKPVERLPAPEPVAYQPIKTPEPQNSMSMSSSSFFDSLVSDIENTLEEMPTSELLPVAKPQAAPTPSPESDFGLEAGLLSIFEEFKSGLEQNEAPDFETHYNLGLAYKDMELYDDAIEEFQIACKATSPSNSDGYYFNCCNMLGFCFLQNNMARPAAVWYKRGLEAPQRNEDEYQAMRYDLGSSYERLGEYDKALELFQEVYAIDINYRNVSTKIRELQNRIKRERG